MLYTKFQQYRPVGSKEDFKRFLPNMGMAATLLTWTGPFEQTFVPPYHKRFHMKYDFDWPSAFCGEDVWRVWTTEAYLYYKLTNEPLAMVS